MTDDAGGFRYRSIQDLKAHADALGAELPARDDLSVLATPIGWGRRTAPNRLAIQPMEGCDATPEGGPTDLTLRKYARFAAGGAGLIWWEACAVAADARANPRQLWLHERTLDAFRAMVAAARSAARDAVGHEPICVLQLTHSGRYCRPEGEPRPVIAHHSSVLDPTRDLPPDYPLITDEELDRLQDAFVRSAELAADAGFDAVDIKACHRYLLNELLASHTRRGRYGGSYEGRTRFLRETAEKVRQAVGDRIDVTTRVNAYDAIPYPYGWGVDRADFTRPDLSEPTRLLGELADAGMCGANITAGNPYYNPHVNRPEGRAGGEHPLEGVARLAAIARDLQRAHPGFPLVGSGYSWLRHLFPQVAAGVVGEGWAGLVGLGRGALAYPGFARDILHNGRMDPGKACITCGKCTTIMRDGGEAGCVVRDAGVYGPIYRRGRRAAEA